MRIHTTGPFLIAGLSTFVILVAGRVEGHEPIIDAVPPGFVENGVPLIDVLDPQFIGLRTVPTDIHWLPDGRMLLLAANELAIGDGVRWEVFSQAADDEGVPTNSVIVDDDGSIYAGIRNGFGRVEFGEDARWRFARVGEFPTNADMEDRVMFRATAAGDKWLWSSGSGIVLSWRPGEKAELVGSTPSIERIFYREPDYFLSDNSNGSLSRMTDRRFELFIASDALTPGDAITSAVPLEDGSLLIGTRQRGLKIFDGDSIEPFVDHGPSSGGRQIGDLCEVQGGYLAAAVHNLGIVFFEYSGRIVQTLDLSLDRRLSQVRRLFPAPDGVLWALLEDGVARVQFPTRVTQFQPLLTIPAVTAEPFRMNGILWILGDGTLHRATYDSGNRLNGFEIDAPPDRFCAGFSTVAGLPLVGTDGGFYGKINGEWKLLEAEIVNGRILHQQPVNGRWIYGARGEIGWVTVEDGVVEFDRVSVPGLREIYESKTGAGMDIWVELGSGTVGRVKVDGGGVSMEILGAKEGLPDGWTQIFELDGVVRFNSGGSVFHFDESAGKFAKDTEFFERFKPEEPIVGRPGRDALGRIWMVIGNRIRIFEDSAESLRIVSEGFPATLRPVHFRFERDGVVWMHEARKLARFDPGMPRAPVPERKAMVTKVRLPGSKRTVFPKDDRLPPLDYPDNSVEVDFVALGDPFGAPVTFDVTLEGGSANLVTTGVASPAVFTQLMEGDYVLRVLPVAAGEYGTEDTLAFSISPPWYRTLGAYVGYVVGAVGIVSFVVWVVTYLERRDKLRLEGIVLARTNQLFETNLRLERQASALRTSEERYRRLNELLEKKVEERTAQLHGANELLLATNDELEAFSYSVSHDLRAPLRNISGFADLLRKRNGANLDAEGSRFLEVVSNEATRLAGLIGSLLAFSRLNRTEIDRQPVDIQELVQTVRDELTAEVGGRAIEWRIGGMGSVTGDPTLLRQVFVNLIGNALKFTRARDPAVIEIGQADGPEETTFFVRDNGVGFDSRYTDKMFGVFQRLHRDSDYEGSGIGLANVKRIVTRHGGRVWAEGVEGGGATFYFTIGRAATDGSA